MARSILAESCIDVFRRLQPNKEPLGRPHCRNDIWVWCNSDKLCPCSFSIRRSVVDSTNYFLQYQVRPIAKLEGICRGRALSVAPVRNCTNAGIYGRVCALCFRGYSNTLVVTQNTKLARSDADAHREYSDNSSFRSGGHGIS